MLELPLRAPRRLTLESGTIINRGLRDVAPKYLDHAKIAGSLIRQISENRVDNITASSIFMPFSGNEADRLSTLLPNCTNLSISAPLIGSLIERIYTLTGRTVLAVVGPVEINPADSLTAFAKALVSHDRQLEVTLAKDLMARARDVDLLSSKDHRFDRESIVIEEKGGKFGQLALEEPTIKQQLKKWQILTGSTSARDSKVEGRPPLDTPVGFGAGATIMSDAQPSDSLQRRSLYFAASSARLPDVLSVELVAQWRHTTHGWLKDLGIPPESLKRVYVSMPYMAISAFVAQAFANPDPAATLLMYPDQVYGWHPLLTLLAMIRQPMLPALFVHGGFGLSVQVAAVWAAS
jgi:hypothetical protein